MDGLQYMIRVLKMYRLKNKECIISTQIPVLMHCLSFLSVMTDLYSHMHTIIQLVNNILQIVIPCHLHL